MLRLMCLGLLAFATACKSADPAPPSTPPAAATPTQASENSCTTGSDCKSDERCTTDDGACNPPPGCTAAAPCVQVCTGSCVKKAVAAASCSTDADCRLVPDQCTGCKCLSLGLNDPKPECEQRELMCLVAPCQGKKAVCKAGICATIGSAGAPAQ